MDRSALFADINKLRNKTDVIDDKAVKKANKTKKPPPPSKTDQITSNLNRQQPISATSLNKTITPTKMTPNTSFSPLSGTPEPEYKRKKSKKKKKKKRKYPTNQNGDSTNLEISHDTVNSDDVYKFEESRLRQKTQISVLANESYPDANSLFDFQNKPPLLVFTYTFAFIASIDCFVNIPTLYAACNEAVGHNSYYYAFILAVYVGTQFVSTLFIGAWLDRRSIIEILTFLTVCIIIGNVLYTFGVHDKNGMYMLIGRGICGCGSCILVLGYAHVTRYTKLASRESRILYLRFVIALGTIIGPLIGTILGGGEAHLHFLSIDENNSGSFVVACIGGVYLLALIIFCIARKQRQEKKEEDRALWGRSESESEQIDAQYSNLHYALDNYVWRPHRFCSPEAFMLWFLYTTAVFTFWSFCGAIIPVGASQGSNNLSTTKIYAVFVYVGITYLMAFGLNKVVFGWCKIQMEKRVIVSLILMIFGSIFLTSFGLDSDDNKNIYTWQIVVATPFLTSGFCISTITIPALYVTLVGAQVAGLGLRMSWFFSLASFGILAGPVYGFLMWKYFGSVNFISHTSALVLLLALLVGFVMIKVRNTGHGFPKKVKSSLDNEEDNDLNQGLLADRL